MQPLWWHWIVFGLCLGMAELVLPSFFIIWFGLGAPADGEPLVVLAAAKLGTTRLIDNLELA